jgi:hypothetical protein
VHSPSPAAQPEARCLVSPRRLSGVERLTQVLLEAELRTSPLDD